MEGFASVIASGLIPFYVDEWLHPHKNDNIMGNVTKDAVKAAVPVKNNRQMHIGGNPTITTLTNMVSNSPGDVVEETLFKRNVMILSFLIHALVSFVLFTMKSLRKCRATKGKDKGKLTSMPVGRNLFKAWFAGGLTVLGIFLAGMVVNAATNGSANPITALYRRAANIISCASKPRKLIESSWDCLSGSSGPLIVGIMVGSLNWLYSIINAFTNSC